MIAIIIPTRGLLFSQVIQRVEEIRTSTWRKTRLYMSYDMPIPDSFTHLVERAYEDGASDFWFIEEDVIPPLKSMDMLVNECYQGISFIDYGVEGWSCSARDKNTDEVLWCGFGCTMVQRSVFDSVGKPWFRTDKKLRLNTMEWYDVDPKTQYGGQDIWFFTHAREKGYKIRQVKGQCQHLKIESLGEPQVNNGLHNIGIKKMIEKQQYVESR